MSCSLTSVTIKDTWRMPDAQDKDYKTLLVIGATREPNLRKTFENIFVETLREHGVEAIRSYPLIEDLHKVDSSKLQGIALQAGADGVILTKVISKEEHANYQYAMGTLERKTVVIKDSTPDSDTTLVMSAVGIAPRETDIESALLQTRLFDAQSEQLVWTAHTSLIEAEDRAGASWKLSALLVKALAKDNLVTINSKKFHIPKP